MSDTTQPTLRHPVPAAPGAPAAPAVGETDLRARRDRLAREVAERQWDLGGLAFEMAVRDHFRLDVLLRVAARMQEADAQLADVDRLLALEDRGAAGTCPSCRALYARGAVYCWQCGIQLLSRAEPRTT
jgi:hypothetical protein